MGIQTTYNWGKTNADLADMSNKLMPYNTVIQDGILLDDFSSLSGWADASKLSLDTLDGEVCTKFTETTVAALTSLDKTINWDLKTMGSISLWFSCNTDTLSSFRIYLSSDAAFSTSYNIIFNSTTGYDLKNGLNHIKIPRTAFTNSGTPDNFINPMIRIRFNIQSKAGQTATVYLKKVEYNQKSLPFVIIDFDDGYEEVYNNLFAYASGKGIKMAVNIVSDVIGSAGRFTTTMLDAMYDAGWDICPHAKASADYTTLTTADLITDATTVRDYILGRGYVRSAYHWAYPNGVTNDTIISTLQGLGVLSGRLYGTQGTIASPVDQFMRMHSYPLMNTTTSDELIAVVKRAMNYGGYGIRFTGHKVVETPASGLQVATAVMTAFIDWLVVNRIMVITPTEYYNIYSNGKIITGIR